jgi:hypothetical protein
VERDVFVGRGSVVAGIELKVGPGAKLLIRYDGSARAAVLRIDCAGSLSAFGLLERNRPLLQSVPGGALRVRLYAGDAEPLERRVDIVTGEQKEIVFTDDR